MNDLFWKFTLFLFLLLYNNVCIGKWGTSNSNFVNALFSAVVVVVWTNLFQFISRRNLSFSYSKIMSTTEYKILVLEKHKKFQNHNLFRCGLVVWWYNVLSGTRGPSSIPAVVTIKLHWNSIDIYLLNIICITWSQAN